jgi:hypothetical protein
VYYRLHHVIIASVLLDVDLPILMLHKEDISLCKALCIAYLHLSINFLVCIGFPLRHRSSVETIAITINILNFVSKCVKAVHRQDWLKSSLWVVIITLFLDPLASGEILISSPFLLLSQKCAYFFVNFRRRLVLCKRVRCETQLHLELRIVCQEILFNAVVCNTNGKVLIWSVLIGHNCVKVVIREWEARIIGCQ